MTKLDSITKLAVIGAGQMGGGIAQVCAAAGYDVSLCDLDQTRAGVGKANIATSLQRLVLKGKLAADGAQWILGKIITPDLTAGLAGADLAIEAVTESFPLKADLFKRIDHGLRPGALIASNTSSISITKLAACTGRPEQVIGLHFMNPVPVMKLLEIVLGTRTSPETLATAQALGAKLGKSVIVSKDHPGFIINRILIPLLNEACFALQEGVATAEDIDAGARLGLNHPMGPLELADLIGLDTVLAISEVLLAELGDDKYRPATILRNLVAAGFLGRKTGRGFYVYDRGDRPSRVPPGQ
jgi:3-hydroxybutyryl-CoA dehydrogenase